MADSFGQNVLSAVLGAIGGTLSGVVTALITESTKSANKRKDAIEELIEEIRVSAIGYWRKRGRDTVVESVLKLLLERLDVKFEGLFPNESGQRIACLSGSQSLWEEITSGAFESDTREPDTERVRRIAEKSRELVAAMRGAPSTV